MKLYTSDEVIDLVRDSGGVLQMYWDDFELWKDTNLVLNITENGVIGDFKFFPNPMRNYSILQFNNPTNKNHTLIIYNVQGQIIRTITGIKSEQVEIKKENLTSGFYFFRLVNDKKTSVAGKFIVE